jgi:hypothetical protein
MKAAIVTLIALSFSSVLAHADSAPNARALVERLLEADPFGLAGATVVARLTLSDKNGSKRQLAFASKSKRYDPPFAKSIVRFSEPADLAGAAFLQVQNRSGDDDRFLFLPELKRPRRIAGGLRSSAFMGTDFSYADLDQRDFRDGNAVLKSEETVAKWSCDVLDIVPKSSDSQYSHVEIWLRKDNSMPIRMRMYDRQKVLLKTFEALEFKRVSGRWFVSKSRLTNQQLNHTTELDLQQITVTNDLPDDTFSLRALEKS